MKSLVPNLRWMKASLARKIWHEYLSCYVAVLAFGSLIAVIPAAADAEIYLSDPTMEISGNGARSWRSCAVVLKPTKRFSETASPRLILTTTGVSRLSLSVERPAEYTSLVVVQDNGRQSFSSMENISIDQFRISDVGKAFRSGRLFFITAQKGDSNAFLSSRYERLDLDSLLAKVETHCPFDAESLMSDTSSRERAERNLSVSSSDLKLIRWALNKKYGASSEEPGYSASLSAQERGYLKRYAAENGLPVSNFLTRETVRKLSAEGQEAETLAKPPERWNSVAAGIWKVNGNVRVAVGYSGLRSSRDEAIESAEGKCREIGRNCKATGGWNSGCLYITTGSSRGSAGWSAGASIADVMKSCRAKGYSCQTPIGGCID